MKCPDELNCKVAQIWQEPRPLYPRDYCSKAKDE